MFTNRICISDGDSEVAYDKSGKETCPTETAILKNPTATPGDTGLRVWHDLPGAKDLISKIPATINSNCNKNVTVCPVSLTADVIFELDED